MPLTAAALWENQLVKPTRKKYFTVQQFRTDQEGARMLLHNLEADVLEQMWKGSASGLTVREVHKTLEKSRAIAYTTVMTTMDRLWKKGVLRRERQGKAYLYAPLLERSEFYRQAAGQVFECLLHEVTEPLLASFIDSAANLDSEHLDRLEELIQQKRRELGQASGKEA